MEGGNTEMLKASFLSGLLPPVLAPALWPFVVLLSEGRFPSWEVYPTAALSIMFFALLIGICACVVLGFPCLVTLEKFNLNRPAITSIAGLLLSVMLFFMIDVGGEEATKNDLWPVLAFFAVLGAAWGAAASILSRPNKANSADTKSGAADQQR